MLVKNKLRGRWATWGSRVLRAAVKPGAILITATSAADGGGCGGFGWAVAEV
jgi:hypothetical protein